MLDVRLGRWFSPDVITQPWQSSYTSMDNNPVALTDVLGAQAGGGGGTKGGDTPCPTFGGASGGAFGGGSVVGSIVDGTQFVPEVTEDMIFSSEGFYAGNYRPDNYSFSETEKDALITFAEEYENEHKGCQNCCIDCMNKGLGVLYDKDPTEFIFKNRKPRISHSMNILQKEGKVQATVVLTAKTKEEKPIEQSSGEKGWDFDKKIAAVMMDMVNNSKGIFMFGVAPGNGYHSLFIILDNTNTEKPIFSMVDPKGHQVFKSEEDINDYLIIKTNAAINDYRTEGHNDWDVKTYITLLKP